MRIISVSAASLLPKAPPAPGAQPHVLVLLGVIYGRGLIQRRCAGPDFPKLSFVREERACLRSSPNPAQLQLRAVMINEPISIPASISTNPEPWACAAGEGDVGAHPHPLLPSSSSRLHQTPASSPSGCAPLGACRGWPQWGHPQMSPLCSGFAKTSRRSHGAAGCGASSGTFSSQLSREQLGIFPAASPLRHLGTI